MKLDKWMPVYAPEVEGGAAGDDPGIEPAPRPVPMNERPVDGPGSGRGAIRKELENSVKEVRERESRAPKPVVAKKPAGYQSRAAEMRGDAGTQDPALQVDPSEPPEPEALEQPKEPPPDAYPAEAKADWAKTPASIRAAAIKRELDVANGVQALRNHYAEIDHVLGPRAELIKSHGHTPAQAVNQLFSWFDALAQDVDRVKAKQPPMAFIALAKSFGLDKLIEESMKPAAANGQPGAAAPAGDIPPALQEYIGGLQKQVGELTQYVQTQMGGFQQNLQQQNMAKTNEVLAHWAQGKEHFEAVRPMMAHLLQSGAVPPLADGRADLDRAYDAAVYAMPEVRSKVLAAQKAAETAAAAEKAKTEQAARQAEADKARRRGGGLPPGAPGATDPLGAGGKKKGSGRSVRESLLGAIDELS